LTLKLSFDKNYCFMSVKFVQSPRESAGSAPLSAASSPRERKLLKETPEPDFPCLEIDPLAPRRQVRVCIVTPEFVGPTRNGGIGTAYTSLAQVLARAGHEVTVLYTNGDWSESGSVEHWEEHYRKQGILLVRLRPPDGISVASPYFAKRSYETYLWLKRNEKRFDIVHFPEWQGQGYYSLLAKRQGLAFEQVSFCVGVHSSTKWVELGNQRLYDRCDQLDEDFLERESVRLADAVISPSQYLLRWMRNDGWRFPSHVRVAPYAVPDDLIRRFADRNSRKTASAKRGVRELIFFGRLEPRKGAVVFCDAIDRLSERLPERRLRVTFVGKSWLINGEDAATYIRSRAKKWPFDTQVLSKDRAEALTYLQRASGALVVIPSIIENHPNTVLECLAAEIPFIASNVGGIPEQIAPADRDHVLFAPRADLLAGKIEAALESIPTVAKPAFDFSSNNEALVRWHEQFAAASEKEPKRAPSRERPLVSVCLTHYNRSVCLRFALESLRNQDQLWPFEVILVDDGSTSDDASAYLDQLAPEFAQRGWKIVRQENQYLGSARNTAARHSSGKYLLFMDDDNYADPAEISTLAGVAERTGADILTCVSRLWSGAEAPGDSVQSVELQWAPLGAAIESGLFWNAFGDANALVRREAFEALGGFRELHGITCEDWEFFARAVFSGFDLQMVPLPLFWYRLHKGSMIQTTNVVANRLLAASPYLEQRQHGLSGVLLLSLGQSLAIEKLRDGGKSEPSASVVAEAEDAVFRRKRAQLSPATGKRLRQVWRLLRKGYYRRFAHGLESAFRDIRRPPRRDYPG